LSLYKIIQRRLFLSELLPLRIWQTPALCRMCSYCSVRYKTHTGSGLPYAVFIHKTQRPYSYSCRPDCTNKV
jgi:hypothetical protein